MIAVLCAASSGAALFFSIQLGAQWWLAWIAPIPVLWFAFRGEARWKVVAVCWAAYAIAMCNIIPAYWGQLPDRAILLSILLPGLVLAALVLAARLVASRVSPLAGVFAFAALGTAFFYVHSFGPDGTAGSWAYSQVGSPVLIQSAWLFGIWSIDFLLFFVPAGVAMTLAGGSPWPVGAAIALFVVNAVFGYARMAGAAPGPTVHIGLAADDALAFYEDAPAFTQRVVSAYTEAAQAFANGSSLIVFPEKTAVLTVRARAGVVSRLRHAAKLARATIVMGFDDRSGRLRRNDAYIVSPDGTVSVYDKQHMVPGLEDRFVPGSKPFTRSDHTGVAICKDMDFQRTIRADAHRHPTLMAVPAWDFAGDRWWHARLAIMRGVENGFAVARAAKDGLLTLSDAYGRVLQKKATGGDGMVTLAGDLPRGPGDTLYHRIGDVFAWACIAVGAGLFGLAMLPRRGKVFTRHGENA
jgi:apolipoprotein N-acyltransferase